jgi:hypothetical protein
MKKRVGSTIALRPKQIRQWEHGKPLNTIIEHHLFHWHDRQVDPSFGRIQVSGGSKFRDSSVHSVSSGVHLIIILFSLGAQKLLARVL